MRCEGWRRRGGAFTLGPPVWEQCKSDAIALLRVQQEGETLTFPGCAVCWREALDNTSIVVKWAEPILEESE